MKRINFIILLTLLLGLSSCHKSKLDKLFVFTTYDGTIVVNDRKCEFKDQSMVLIPQYVATYTRINDYFLLHFSLRAEDCKTNEKCSFRGQLTFNGRLPERGKKISCKACHQIGGMDAGYGGNRMGPIYVGTNGIVY